MTRFLPTFLLFPLILTTAHAALMVTYAESPSIYYSTLPNTLNNVETFDAANLVWNANTPNLQWTTSGGTLIGTYDNAYIRGADVNGGAPTSKFAGGTPYIVQSTSVGVPVTTLTLNGDFAYFGFWWSAGDDQNVITFYDDDVLVAQFSTATLLNQIAGDSAYKGNPISHKNLGQSYAYINFYGLEGTKWDKIVFSNNQIAGSPTAGFESDNHTARAAPYNPTTDGPMPGIPLARITGTTVTTVPEPGAVTLAVAAAGLLVVRRRRL